MTSHPQSTHASLAWYVVRTNPNCEGRAKTAMREAGFEPYCPMGRHERRCGRARRRVDVKRPLFCRYVFVGLDPASPPFGAVRRIDGVREFVGIDGTPVRIPWACIEALQCAEDMGVFDFRQSRQAIALEIGDGVVLVSGMFEGWEASVERVPSSKDDPVLLSVGSMKIQTPLDTVQRLA
ncbi:transcription termination/antitermination protein NusG [Roseibium sp. RKSG952]|uniref:transcription termination/antitermination protein NusG n=1 Tax=Roseibium sp. RKSG952 TaxID=2529384 RepID=UPI0012BC8665|nr:transcription termination/antitermination NusG family protein [Roseibium sp. RKSG952]MTH96655.1 hypothetical protein [Roseibium sp. RKSG952]